jgi:subtilisin family serine protease
MAVVLAGAVAVRGEAADEALYSQQHLFARVAPGVVLERHHGGSQGFVTAAGEHAVGVDAMLSFVGAQSIERAPIQAAADRGAALAVGADRWYRISLAPGFDALRAADLLQASWVGFEVVEVDPTGTLADLPNDTSFSTQWSLLNSGQAGGTPGADISASDAWAITTSNASLVIAFLDSGVDPHPELDTRILPGRNIPLGTTNTADVCSGHGTHVAGIATARGNNASGIAGVVWNAKILPVVVVNPCSGLESYVADGLVWAVDNGADIVNMSLQYSVGSAYLQTAVQYAANVGVPMIAATGNSNAAVAFPARWPETIAVAASNRFDARWTQSNFGPEVDVTAPGDTIYSLGLAGSYSTRSGTSMATPHVTGTVALMRAVHPLMGSDAIRAALMQTARDIGTAGFDNYTGAGVIDAGAAVALAQSSGPGPGDLNGDGVVDGFDLAALLTQWGTCTSCQCTADFDDNCVVDGVDLAVVFSGWSGN